jgi:hypothetical protein
MTKAQHKVFKSHFDSWDKMAEQVTEFLSGLGRDRVIGISHSQESQTGVIIVWYWG